MNQARVRTSPCARWRAPASQSRCCRADFGREGLRRGSISYARNFSQCNER
ncbi:hypothetical protein XCR_3502 [Xanthomonas campestris pv. raphani 756C]|nr:hypothetical protein XCR_3502 [Xanthomonas campestris pv. raphani 756C]